MQKAVFIQKYVRNYYWDEDINCATTILKILSKVYGIHLNKQLTDAALGLHGAGGFGAQCGLVEGGLIFIGIIGKKKNLTNEAIVKLCYDYAQNFDKHFGSLACSVLRPQGFNPNNPPHLCESLTNRAVQFAIDYCEEKGFQTSILKRSVKDKTMLI